MLIFNERYNVIVAKYIVPLSEYGIAYSKLRQNALRNLLIEKVQSITINPNNTVSFYCNKKDLLRALINDVEQFYIRTLLQREAVRKIRGDTTDKSTNWNIVTDYYYAYFLCNLLLRLCHRGTFYFDSTTKTSLERIISAYTQQTFSLGSNCYFKIELNDIDLEYKLTLYVSTKKTHELVWEKTASLLDEIKVNGNMVSDEYTVLQSISEVNKKMGSAYPSNLRNRVNYQPYYGIKEIERKYDAAKILDLDHGWLAPILEFDGKKTDDDQKTINLFSGYVKYLQTFTFNLINEYNERRGRGAGVLSSINNNRISRIVPPSPVYKYL